MVNLYIKYYRQVWIFPLACLLRKVSILSRHKSYPLIHPKVSLQVGSVSRHIILKMVLGNYTFSSLMALSEYKRPAIFNKSLRFGTHSTTLFNGLS